MNEEAQIASEDEHEKKHPDDLVLDLSGEEYRDMREQQIEEELEGEYNYHTEDEDVLEEIQAKREKEYEDAMKEVGDLPVTEESKEEIKKKMVDDVIEKAKEENEHFDKLIREKKIINYLDRELEGEERIEREMDESCEVSVVVPVYAERDYIFRPLKSLTEQEDVESNHFEAIFVVNNKGEEPRRDIDETDADYQRKLDLYHKAAGEGGENQQVINIINHINGEKLVVDLSKDEKKVVRDIKKKGINVHVIDKASEGKTLSPGEDNVGGARNRGVAEAVARFYEQKHENGIIAQTDSDSRMDKDYIRNIISTFNNNPDMVGARGELEFEQAFNSEVFRKVANYQEMNYRYNRLLDYYFKLQQGDEETIQQANQVAFSGANMMSRAYESAIVGGVPKKAGGEDPEFGYRLANIGNTKHIEEVKTYPADRESARTAVWAGHGQNKIKAIEAFQGKDTINVDCLDYMKARNELGTRVKRLFDEGRASLESLREAFTFNGGRLLEDNDLKRIIAMAGEAGDIKKIEMSDERREIRHRYENALRKIYPKQPVDEAAEELIDDMRSDGTIGKKFEAIYSAMAEEEDKWVGGRQDKMDKVIGIIFANPERGEYSEEEMLSLLKQHKDKIGLEDEGIENISNERHILIRLVKSINQADSETEAMENLKSAFEEEMSPVEEHPAKKRMLELRAMHQAKRELNK